MKLIFHEQTLKFKCNASIGFILLNQNEEELRYFHASMGVDKLLASPKLIENLQDFNQIVKEMTEKDFVEKATQNRPNTS